MKGVIAVLFLAVWAAAQAGPLQLSPTQKELKVLRELYRVHEAAATAYHMHPNDGKLRKQYVFSTVKLGVRTMYAQYLPSRIKYSNALKFFKEALAVDPTNKDARQQKQMIEAIYRKLGRKPPG